MFTEAEGTRFQREYERAMESQEAVSFVEYYPPLSTWFEVRAYPSETGLSVYFRDVTERKEREQELERYETIVETVEDGIYILDDDMKFSMVNSALCEMTGFDREELLGESAWEFVENDDEVRDVIAENTDEMVAGDRTSATVEIDAATAEGGTFPAQVLFVVRDTGDGLEHVGIVRDVTEQKHREEELHNRVTQQQVLSEFSQHALEDRPLDDLMDEAVELVAETLGQEYSKVLKLRPDEEDLLLRAGYGWDRDAVGSATVDTETGSQAGYTLMSKEPIVVRDYRNEDRFSYPDLLASQNLVSGVSTIIGSPGDPWGFSKPTRPSGGGTPTTTCSSSRASLTSSRRLSGVGNASGNSNATRPSSRP
ncbi:PAS domain S-box protein [Halorussus caseinilyticus]|uniref:PAS domain S-box protein n=1 Tax=Halorussus caseinilyticus TaxID=3034025 RepID=A0ABD5WQT4_9EURY